MWNEIHPHWGGTPAEQAAALQRIGEGVRDHEERCNGFSRPQTVSIFGPDPGDYADLIFRGSGLDFATTHIYQGAIDFPQETVQPALLMAKWVRHGVNQTPMSRPFTDSEHGPIHLFNDHRKYLPEPFDDEYERRLMWAHLASGGAGSGLRWPARHPHTATEGMLRSLRNLSRFLTESGIDWRNFQSRDANDSVGLSAPKDEPFHHASVADDRQSLVYLLRDLPKKHKGITPQRRPLADLSVRIAVNQPGDYRVRIWDTVKGEMIKHLSRRNRSGARKAFPDGRLGADGASAPGS
jgi:mannan endo-1,4-beta-mannosidase